jgi:hypothetical protein
MNCQRFEDVVSDIAREQILDVTVRSEALGHSRECRHCAARLEDELAISLDLRTFASSFESVGAPARVEAQLLAAFANRSPVTSHSPYMSRQLYWISAIAAVLLIVFAVSVFRLRQSVPAKESARDVITNAVPPASLVWSPPASSIGQDGQTQSSVPRKGTLTARHNRRAATSITSQAKPTGPTSNNEIATDFLPVTYGGAANLADGGRMVRVELPRSAMASFGLPVNMDRANERVKADVLLGVDGLAHAIRFVQ